MQPQNLRSQSVLSDNGNVHDHYGFLWKYGPKITELLVNYFVNHHFHPSKCDNWWADPANLSVTQPGETAVPV